MKDVNTSARDFVFLDSPVTTAQELIAALAFPFSDEDAELLPSLGIAPIADERAADAAM